MENDFYIGWQPEEQPSAQKARRRFFMIAISSSVLVIALLLMFTKPFISSRFFFGELTTLEGRLLDYPVLSLQTTIDGEEKTVPLVGFGKFSPAPAFDDYDLEELKQSRVTLRGTLITYQEKYWMELTEGKQSVLSVNEGSFPPMKLERLGMQTIKGEIVDPKCFFGVMNPAFKKIHRSCAIRCISGGIPPILALRENGEFVDYYFVLDDNGLPAVGMAMQMIDTPVEIAGIAEQAGDWKAIKMASVKEASTLILDSQLALCAD